MNLRWHPSADETMEYCVYLIVYKGRDMPPFYVGKTSTWNMVNADYHGSVASKAWMEKWHSIYETHPELFSRIILFTFKTDKEAHDCEVRIISKLRLHINELHVNLHNGGSHGWHGNGKHLIGKKRDRDIVERTRKSMIGVKHSEERKQKIREANSKPWSEARRAAHKPVWSEARKNAPRKPWSEERKKRHGDALRAARAAKKCLQDPQSDVR